MTSESISWIAFHVFILAVLALDLGVFHRQAHVVKMKEALTWVVVWVTLAMLFNLGIYLGWVGNYPAELRDDKALEFLTGYLIEESLSVDNVFVFALVFRAFHIPAMYQHRVLFWGIIGALVMRAIMIFAGVALLKQFHFLLYIFGGFLVITGIRMWKGGDVEIDREKNPLLRISRRLFPVTREFHGQSFFVRMDGKLALTPLAIALIAVEWTDLVFAVDSIPAVLAVSHDPFIVYTSNIMAILGLRSMYFALSGMMQKFHLLHYGLAVLLVFIGTKMLVADLFKLPTKYSLMIIVLILGTAVVASLMSSRKEEAKEEPAE